jgi:predicted TIM-barrel fold metal-dependent hydrolase
MIVDAQIHLWSKGETLPPHRAAPYLMDEVLDDMDDAKIARAIIHPPSWDPDSGEIAIAAAKAKPDRFAILGQFPLEDPASRNLVAGWKQQPGMLGMRFAFLSPERRQMFVDGSLDWLWAAAEKASVPIAMLANFALPKVSEIAARHPGLKLIVDHCGGVHRQKGDAAFATMPEVAALAKHPNVALKATGGPGYAADGWPYLSLGPRYRQMFDAFGPDRMFWGTDITRMPCSWPECVMAFNEATPWLSDADRAKVMGRAVCDWLGWKV